MLLKYLGALIIYSSTPYNMHSSNKNLRSHEMAWQAKISVTRPSDLKLTPGTSNMKEQTDSHRLSYDLQTRTRIHSHSRMPWHMHSHTPTYISSKQLLKSKNEIKVLLANIA